MLLNDKQIEHYALAGMITPFEPVKIRQRAGQAAISFGCSGHGYDIRLAPAGIKIPHAEAIMNPKYSREDWFYEPELITTEQGTYFELPGNSFCLAHSVETFDMPTCVFAIAVGKSTYARCGLVANITPLEAGWRGVLTLELNNNHRAPIQIYVQEGIVQLLFFQTLPPAQGAYTGAYQNQTGTMLSNVTGG